MKSTIEIKTAFEGCAEVCDMCQIDFSYRRCVYTDRCKKIGKTLAKLSEQDDPLDEMFADSMEKLDGLGGCKNERMDTSIREITEA